MPSKKTIEEIVAAKNRFNELKSYLEDRTAPTAVVFTDLAGSTSLKEKPQTEWLPIICRFLLVITKVAVSQEGRIVKYIGDEVFAAFEDDESGLASNRAETFVWECEAKLRTLGSEYAGKYALDYGQGALVEFENAPDDILGTCVDRCARIAKLAEAHTAVASAEFVKVSKHQGSWIDLGKFAFKGLPTETNVFQLDGLGSGQIEIRDRDLASQSAGELAKELVRLRKELEESSQELEKCRREVLELRSR